MLIFDVPPPLVPRGIDAHMATWEKFFRAQEKPVTFDIHEVKITAGSEPWAWAASPLG
jgi:ketosteroid isomerase-like protein